jgi:hypothetical protein
MDLHSEDIMRQCTCILIYSVMAVVSFCDTIVADETVLVRSILGHVKKRRVNPAAYEFDFTIKKNSIERTNQKNAQLSGGLVQIAGTMRIDELAESSYVESTAKLLDAISESDDRQKSWQAFMEKNRHLGMRLILPDKEFVRFPSGGRITEQRIRGDTLTNVPLFDFRAFGWAGEYDREQRIHIEEILLNYQELWNPSLTFVVNSDGIAALDLWDEDILIDTKRDYWVVSRTKWSCTKAAAEAGRKREARESTIVQLEEFEGHWLPKRCDILSERGLTHHSTSYELKWKTYDKTIDPDKFTREYMEARLTAYELEDALRKEKAATEKAANKK